MKSWKTTLAGLIGGIPTLIISVLQAIKDGQITDTSGKGLAIGVAMILIGAFAKDHNVTGGTVVQSSYKAPNDIETQNK